MIDWEERTVKNQHRHMIYNRLRNKPNVYFSLPGVDCADMKLGVKLNYLNRDTFIVAAENNPRVYPVVKSYLTSIFDNFILQREMCSLKAFPSIDLGFLDFLGNLKQEDMEWMKMVLSNKINDGARLIINVTSTYRASCFVPQIIHGFNKNCQNFVQIQKHLFDNVKVPSKLLKFTTSYAILFEEYLFNEFEYDLVLDSYKELNSPHVMVTFMLENLRKKPEFKLLDVPAILRQNEEEIFMLSRSARSLVKGFPEALLNPHKMRGWKKALTDYCNRRTNETGTPQFRYKAAVKMELTKAGLDCSGV